MKRLLATLSAILLLSPAALCGSSTYPATGLVVNLDATKDIVTVLTGNDMLWDFCGVEDYELGDMVSLLMDDNGTPDDITDDLIVKAQYSGFAFRTEED